MAKHVSEAIFIAIIFLKTIAPQLCIPLGTTLELLRLYFWHSMVRSQLLHLHSLGDFALIELKKEITCDGPIKNLSPPLERKRVP